MKAYRKKLIGLALAAVFSFSPVSVFASSVNITSGLQIGGDGQAEGIIQRAVAVLREHAVVVLA